MTRIKDSQRSRVYAAERCIQSTAQTMELDEAQRFADRVTRSSTWAKLKGRRGWVIVAAGRGGGHAANGWWRKRHLTGHLKRRHELPMGSITLGLWGRQEVVILHELAHIATDSPLAAHGPEFCAAMLKLTRRFLGVEEWRKLREAFKAHRVRHRPRKKRILTEEQRAELRARFAAIRAARAQAA